MQNLRKKTNGEVEEKPNGEVENKMQSLGKKQMERLKKTRMEKFRKKQTQIDGIFTQHFFHGKDASPMDELWNGIMTCDPCK